MKYSIFLLLFGLCFKLNGQAKLQCKGITFREFQNWSEVIAQATSENKYIFVDCFATWCAPCKAMDINVFSDDTVGKIVNDQFISVRVRMDGILSNNKQLIECLDDHATQFAKVYGIDVFPTFLFFSSDGKPIHKSTGYKNKNQFRTLINDALDSQKQLYKIISNYNDRRWTKLELKSLAKTFRNSAKEFACKVAADYIGKLPKVDLFSVENIEFITLFKECISVQYLVSEGILNAPIATTLNENQLQLFKAFKSDTVVQKIVTGYLKKLSYVEVSSDKNLQIIMEFSSIADIQRIAYEYIKSLSFQDMSVKRNIELVCKFTMNSSDVGFGLLRENSKMIDSVMGQKNYVNDIVDQIIYKEIIYPLLTNAFKSSLNNYVNWKRIYWIIKKKYNSEYASRCVLKAKVLLYRSYTSQDSNWKEYIKFNLKLLRKYGVDTSGYSDAVVINNFCWYDVFFHSNSNRQIKKAIRLMGDAVLRHPEDGNMDTYANLLYKYGKTKIAIVWERRALALALNNGNGASVNLYKNTIYKMQNKIPTWIIK